MSTRELRGHGLGRGTPEGNTAPRDHGAAGKDKPPESPLQDPRARARSGRGGWKEKRPEAPLPDFLLELP